MKNSKTKFIKTRVSALISGITVELEEDIEVSQDVMPDYIEKIKLDSLITNLSTLNNFIVNVEGEDKDGK
jgi:hypothetical protein